MDPLTIIKKKRAESINRIIGKGFFYKRVYVVRRPVNMLPVQQK